MLKSDSDTNKLTAQSEDHEIQEHHPDNSADMQTPQIISYDETHYYQPLHQKRELTREEVSTRLSYLGKVAGGDGYAFLKTSCTDLDLTELAVITHFKHLQYVDVSNNYLNLDALQVVTSLPFLILIQADRNILHSAALNTTKYLQVIIMNNNTISKINDVYQPELCTLEVGHNKIREVSFKKHMPNIKCLDFRYNLIEKITNFDFPNLDSLYLAGNKITSLIGIENLVNLRILHLRYNPIKLLDGFYEGNKKLQYINLRNCQVATLRQIKKLRILPALETLVIKGCPYLGGSGDEDNEMGQEEEDSDIRVEVVATLPRLKRLNKGDVSFRERAEAKDLMHQWFEEEEKDEEELETEEFKDV